MAVINHLAVTDPDSGEVTTYEIQDALHDQTAELLNHDPVIELKNSIVDHDQKGYNAETLSETLNSGTENNIYTRYLAKRQITGISANATNTGIIVETVNQTGAEQSQEIDFTGLDTETLTARVTANENSIASLNTRVTNAQTELNEHAGEIASAQADITQAQADITQAQTDITSLQNSRDTHTNAISQISSQIAALGRTLFPVGSIFTTTTNTNPSTFLGGTWEQFGKDKFLLGAGDTYTAGSEGGSSGVTLAQENIPDYTLGVVPVPPPTNGQNWDNENVKFVSMGATSTNKPGVTGENILISTGDQYGYQISSGGSGAVIETLPPYVAVYFWRRTA